FNLGVRDVSEYDCLLEQYQRLAFLSWVAFDRRPAQNIPNLERLSCPLLWCRRSFDDHNKLVNHVATCSFLEQGEYWCPYHQQSERFSTKHPRKHFFKGAVNAIRKLGSMSIRRAIHPSKSRSFRDARWSKQHVGPRYEYEDDLAEMDERDILELDGGVSKSMSTGSFWHCRQEAFAGYMPAEMEDVRSPAAELASDNLSCPPMEWQSTGVPTPDSALSPISPVSPTDQWQVRSDNEFQTPISPNEDVASVPWTINPMLLTKIDQPAHDKQNPNSSYQALKFGSSGPMSEIRVDTSFANLTAYMWEAPSERLTGNSIPLHETSTVHGNRGQLPPTSGTTGDNLRPANTMNNLQGFEPAGSTFDQSYVPTYPHQEFNQPAMQSSENPQMQVIREVITGPLLTRRGLEGFIPVVREIHLQLFNFWKITVRELQLGLLRGGMLHAQSHHLCDMYVGTVIELCNQAVNLLGEDCSMEEQDRIRQIHVLLQHYQEQQRAGYAINAPEVDLTPYASPYASNNASHGYGTPVSAEPSEPFQGHWGYPDPTTITGPSTSGSTSPQDVQDIPDMPELDHNTGYNPPQPEIQPPPTAGPLASVPSAPQAELACDECGKVLRGKQIWLDSNMQRHKREKHSLTAVLFTCPVEDCGKTFSRKHNLKVHGNTVHKDLKERPMGLDG
ncbi:hypothetical protein MMC30_004942, partial [Trapelia coarctata]|nr:hypothetical protein [Trapelia coarctata]